MDHLDELRVATASSLPLNGLAPRTYAKDHATFEALSSQRGRSVHLASTLPLALGALRTLSAGSAP